MKKLTHGKAKTIRLRTKFSAAYISDILTGKVRLDTWSTAKKLASATNTNPYLWLEGSQDEIVTQVEQNMSIPQ